MAFKRSIDYGGARKRSRMMAPRAYRTKLLGESKSHANGYTSSGTKDIELFPNEVPSGGAPNERDGRKVKLTQIKGLFKVDSSQNVRVIMYQPKSDSDRLSLTDGTFTVDHSKFWVMYDRVVPNNGAIESSGLCVYRPNLGLNTEYDGPSAANIVKGRVIIYMILMDGTGNWSASSQVWYKDF